MGLHTYLKTPRVVSSSIATFGDQNDDSVHIHLPIHTILQPKFERDVSKQATGTLPKKVNAGGLLSSFMGISSNSDSSATASYTPPIPSLLYSILLLALLKSL